MMSLCCAAVLVLTACGSDDPQVTPDSGVKPPTDSGSQIKDPPASVTCSGDCKEYAMRKLILPISDPTKYAYMQGGKPFNQLGSILGIFKDMPMQAAMDESLTSGSTVFLIRLKSTDFTTMTNAVGQVWIGQDEECCTTPEDLAACTPVAVAKCFTGTYEFTKGTQTATVIGDIKSGKFDMHGKSMNIELPLSGSDTITLPLEIVQIRGTLEGDTIKDGAIAGAITKANVDTKLIPDIAKLLTGLLIDDTVEETTKTQLKALDTNDDKTITAEELKTLVGPLLAGDVDVNADGTKELSLGVGFDAVKAVIK